MSEQFNEDSYEITSTRYVVQTTDKRELLLYLNATRMLVTLYELISWKNDIYNGRTYDESYTLYNGKLYNEEEWVKSRDTFVSKEDLDERGIIKKGKVKTVYLEDDLVNILDRKLEDIMDFVCDYMR